MARNGSGTYTVPNTFVAGTAITASDHNENWSDLASEMTNSIAADGQTPFTGPAKFSSGSAALPGAAFSSDADTGMYRKAANQLGFATGGVIAGHFDDAQKLWLAGALDVTGELSVTGALTFVDATISGHLSLTGTDYMKLPVGTTAQRPVSPAAGHLRYNSTTATPEFYSTAWTSLTPLVPRGYIDGCIASNSVGDTTNDISISAGLCADSTGVKLITCAAMTKQLDANWVAGTNQGVRNSAAGIADTTYHYYGVMKADGTQDYYAHTSTTVATVLAALQAESGGADYIYARRLFSVVRASAAILQFVQDGDEFQLKTPILDESSTAITSSASTLTLESIPNGIRVKANFSAHLHVAAGTPLAVFSDMSVNDVGPASDESTASGAAVGLSGSGISDGRAVHIVDVWTNTTRQFRARSLSNTNCGLTTLGWRDPRGKDA